MGGFWSGGGGSGKGVLFAFGESAAARFAGALSGLGHGVGCVGRRGIAALRCGGFGLCGCDDVMNLNLVVSYLALSIKWTNLNLQGTLIGFRIVKKGFAYAVNLRSMNVKVRNPLEI